MSPRDAERIAITLVTVFILVLCGVLVRALVAEGQDASAPRSRQVAAQSAAGPPEGNPAPPAPKSPQTGAQRWQLRGKNGTPPWLARCLVAEAGWTAVRDHLAIRYAVHARAKRRGVTIGEQVRTYCAGLMGPATRRQRWVRELAGDREPPGWPQHVSWPQHLPLWRAVLRLAAEPPTRPEFCRLPPEHWGARNLPADVRRMAAALASGRWVDAGCRGTRNRFAALSPRTLPASVAGGK